MHLRLIKSELPQKACWSVIAGNGSGSVICLDFGRKLPRIKPLKNPTLTEEQRNYEGEYSLYIECAWRLQTKKQVLCSSTSSNMTGQDMLNGLSQLIGGQVVKVAVRALGGDLTIHFDNGLILLVFADQGNEADDIDNYTYYSTEWVITNGSRSHISKQSRKVR